MLGWGTAPVMLKYLTAHVPDGFTTNLIRYPIASMVYLPFVVMAARRGDLRGFWLVALIPASVNVLGQTLWAVAPYYMAIGSQAFVVRLGVVWGIVAAFVMFPDERQLLRSPRFWTGAILAMAGVTVMIIVGSGEAAKVTPIGVSLILTCGVCYGLYGVGVRFIMGRRNPLIVFGVVGLYTSVGLVGLAPFGDPKSLLTLGAWPMVIMVLSAFIGISIAHGLYYIAVKRIGVAVASLVLTLTPFVSAVESIVWLEEQFTWLEWVGGGVLTVGAALTVMSQQRLDPTAGSEGFPVVLEEVEAPSFDADHDNS